MKSCSPFLFVFLLGALLAGLYYIDVHREVLVEIWRIATLPQVNAIWLILLFIVALLLFIATVVFGKRRN